MMSAYLLCAVYTKPFAPATNFHNKSFNTRAGVKYILSNTNTNTKKKGFFKYKYKYFAQVWFKYKYKYIDSNTNTNTNTFNQIYLPKTVRNQNRAIL